MRCDLCGGAMRVLDGQMYRYVESGLENVTIENISVYECAGCGERTPIIPRIEELHDRLARAIALKPAPLAGPEIRFLRKQLGMSARKWAALMHVDHTTLSRWENGTQEIGPQSDSLVRLLFFRLLEERTGQHVAEAIAERVAAVNYQAPAKQQLLVNAENPAIVRYQAVA